MISSAHFTNIKGYPLTHHSIPFYIISHFFLETQPPLPSHTFSLFLLVFLFSCSFKVKLTWKIEIVSTSYLLNNLHHNMHLTLVSTLDCFCSSPNSFFFPNFLFFKWCFSLMLLLNSSMTLEWLGLMKYYAKKKIKLFSKE